MTLKLTKDWRKVRFLFMLPLEILLLLTAPLHISLYRGNWMTYLSISILISIYYREWLPLIPRHFQEPSNTQDCTWEPPKTYMGIFPVQNSCKGSQEGARYVLQHQNLLSSYRLQEPLTTLHPHDGDVAGGSSMNLCICSNGSGSKCLQGRSSVTPRLINTTKGSHWWAGCTECDPCLWALKPTVIT